MDQRQTQIKAEGRNDHRVGYKMTHCILIDPENIYLPHTSPLIISPGRVQYPVLDSLVGTTTGESNVRAMARAVHFTLLVKFIFL